MSKNKFDLITAIVGGVELIANGVAVYLGASGTISATVTEAIVEGVTGAGALTLGICARFIKNDAA